MINGGKSPFVNQRLVKTCCQNPKVSVIVPVYNIEKFIGKCVESLLVQSFQYFEALFIDDGSTDNSGRILDSYSEIDNRIKVIHKSNGGLTSARNAGLLIASGDYIAHIDGDDWIEPTYLEVLYSAAESNNADIVFCGYKIAHPSGIYDIVSPLHWDSKEKSLNRYISSGLTTVWASIHRRFLYTDNGIWCPEYITYCEDFHLMVRLCFFANRITSIDKPLYNYRQQADSLLHTRRHNAASDELLTYGEIISFFEKFGVGKVYEQSMAWRTLKASQEMLLDSSQFETFKMYFPTKKKYISNCPFIGYKLKVLAWLVSFRLTFLARIFLGVRKLLGR